MTRPHLRSAATWLVALGLMGYLFYTIPVSELLAALARTNVVHLIAVVLYVDIGSLLADSWALSRVMTWFLAPVSFGEMVPVRAATYLMAILNYNLGQLGLAYFVHRAKGVSLMRASGVVLMTMGTVLLLLAVVGLAGSLLDPTGQVGPYVPLLALLNAGALLYFVVLRIRPGFLARRALLAPLFEAGILGHLKATAVRIPHLAVLLTTHFVGMYGFGVRPPLAVGLVFIPVVLLVASLPITPFGLGTMQVAAVRLFSPYAQAPTPQARQATMLAYSLSLPTLCFLVQALMGLFFLRRVARLIEPVQSADPDPAPGDEATR